MVDNLFDQPKESPTAKGCAAGQRTMALGTISVHWSPSNSKSSVRSSEQLPQTNERDQHEGNSDDNNAFDPVEFHCWPKKSPGDDARNGGAGEYGENPSQHYGLF